MTMAGGRDPAQAVACRRLWQAVLLQQVETALREIPFRAPCGGSMEYPERALDWLQGRDGAMVCALAGMDIEAIRDGVLRARAEGRYHRLQSGRRLHFRKFTPDDLAASA